MVELGMSKTTLPPDAVLTPPVPATLTLTEAHAHEAIREWCAKRGLATIGTITTEYDNYGDQYEPDIRFTGFKVVLPLEKTDG